MPTTEHIHLPLYTDEETPDLSTTGHYNHAMEILDANIGELETGLAEETEQRKAADAELEGKVEEEATTRADADKVINDTLATKADSADVTAIGRRVDNAEVEISANSADLTGIKGLTYGTGQQVFLEEENGEYSSPALEEIQHEIEDSKVNVISPTNVASPATAKSTSGIAIGFGANSSDTGTAIGYNSRALSNSCVAIGPNAYASGSGAIAIGSGLVSASGSYTTAIGYYAKATNSGCAIGTNSTCSEYDAVSIGGGPNDSTALRRLINVKEPKNSTDAATKNYVDTAIAGVSGGGSGLTVISPGDKQAADIYAEVQAAWPNCMLHAGSQYLWPASDTTGDSPTYTFSGMDSDLKLHLAMCGSDSYSVAAMPIATPVTTFGDFMEPTA